MIRWPLRILLGVGLLILLTGALGRFSPLLDIINLAIVPVAFACVLLALILLAISLKRGKASKPMGIVLVICLIVLFPLPDARGSCAADAPRLRVTWLNAEGTTRIAPILAWIDAQHPDIAAFAEFKTGPTRLQEEMRRRFIADQDCLPTGTCSTRIFARTTPLSSAGLTRGTVANRENLMATRMRFDFDGEPLTILATHLPRPFPPGPQREQLAELSTHVDDPANTIVLGDFNATRRMHTLRDFARANALVSNPVGAGTWPLMLDGERTRPFVQIDQVLTGANWTVEGIRATRNLGSDHRGIVAQLCRRTP
ncbi:endonuclease/exonuclease/phosphatase family protein [Aurantiacibacter spongiae]|uniref:Endonuclease/exonuclease/phosphatase domain-containing protein n=1 Tax=Aurantiacibacter spongiae TaxID=2488860 RepID=A0A3N5CY56_9SPHN|nr:endonuclease/exonuclease/phosphatase family protein [Aurantiacibacter spongiae]RPF71579.1 hypothetical protein EG799_08065 [Aurantiacibacter spongiae]